MEAGTHRLVRTAVKKEAALYKWMRDEKQSGFEIKIICLQKGAEYRIAEKKWIAKLSKKGVPLLNGNGNRLKFT